MEPVVSKSAPLHRQVEDYVRARIESGDFAPGSRLPSNPALAKLTGTSVFTVQTALARLAKEGLLDRQAKKATLVAGEKKVLTCAGIFLSRPLENQNLRFFQVLNGLLREKLKDAKVNTLVWTDDRTEEEQSQILPSLKKALEKREVQALIVPLMYGTNKVWLEASGVPTAALGFTLVGLNTTIKTSTHEAVREGLRYMKKQGCRSVGLISGMHVRKDRHVPGEVYDFYDEFLASGATTQPF
jgi:DNA-binding transcriptional regulator YhcF (GntR family)